MTPMKEIVKTHMRMMFRMAWKKRHGCVRKEVNEKLRKMIEILRKH